MSSSPTVRTRLGAFTAALAAVLAVGTLAVAPTSATAAPPSHAEPALPPLFVSEIAPDTGAHQVEGHASSQDNFEFVELTNATDADIDLAAAGYTLHYKSATLSVADDSPAPAIVPAHGSTVFWLRYQANAGDGWSAGSPNAFLFSAKDFWAHHGLPADQPLVYLTGQPGMANSGATAPVTIRHGEAVVSRSTYLPGTDAGAGKPAHYAVPDGDSTDATVYEAKGSASPGSIAPEQLTPGATAPSPPPTQTPTPTPTPSQTPTPTETTEPSQTPGPSETAIPTQPPASSQTPTPVEPTTSTGSPSATPGETTSSTPTTQPSPGPDAPALMVTEVNANSANMPAADGASLDAWEFVEIHNTTDAEIDLTESGVEVVYLSGSTPKTLAYEPGTTVPANGSVVFWATNSRYRDDTASGGVDARLTDQQFRDHYAGLGVDGDYVLAHLTGQDGLNNSGTSMYLTQRGTELSRITWTGGDIATDRTVDFGLPTDAGSTQLSVFAVQQAPTPGTIDPGQVSTPTSEPTPTPSPTDTPDGPTVPEQGPPPPTDPSLAAPLLQVTEVAPDTANVGGADAYEFIEVYNASDVPVGFADFTINYLYIDASEVTTNSALWPAVPADPVIAPGHTLVLWIKNSANGALTAADFNTHFGSDLTLGTDLVEISSAGMANGGLRGIQVMTNSGHDVSRAYYHNDADTVADQPLQYRWDSGTTQTKLQPATATPGYAAPQQVPAGLVATPTDTAAPRIVDLVGGTETPDTEDLALDFEITDDVQVRTVVLTLDTDVDEPVSRSLQFGAPNRYAYTVPAVDLYGKRWVEYSVTASDGTRTTTLDPVRIQLAPTEEAPVRLNVTEGEYVGGLTRLAATTSGDPAALDLRVDGAPAPAPVPALEARPIFAFEATSTDAFFRNGVRMGDQVLTVFDEGFYARVETVTAPIPVEQVEKGEPVTVGIYAGTKAWPEPDPNENNDDFSALNLRLALPDGRVLRPVECGGAGENQEPTVRACPDPSTRIAFNDANQVYFTATFDVPDDAFDSLASVWDTTTVSDGAHEVTATAGDVTLSRTVNIDNTAPTVEPSVIEGDTYRGDFEIDAALSDAGAGLSESGVSATLDGAPVSLPHRTSSLALEPGEHALVITARDRVGNVTTETVRFTTADEQPETTLHGPDDGASGTAGAVELTATAESPEGDLLTMRFREGRTFVPTDAEVSAYSGTTGVAKGTDRTSKVLLSADQLEQVAGTDGIAHEVSSDDELPYQLYTVAVPADSGADARARLTWTGTANAGAKVLMYVREADTGVWKEVARHITTDDQPFTFEELVPVAGHATDGEMTVLVQHSEGFAGAVRSTRDSNPEPYSSKGVTPRSEYDFTFAWESDTQYYNETDDFYQHQLNIHRFLLDQRDDLNLQYMLHTGDIVNVATEERQWRNADPAYRMLDEAGLPYGVLAGNHDVGHHSSDYTAFSQWFGEHRYRDNPWYGGSHQDNRGHFDLVSAGGIDFLMLYMGWAPGEEQIAWMNRVIRAHPERKVWINLHEFMLTTGGLGPIPQRIMDEVVATNPNVFAVSSGHYHDAYTRIDQFDDDGDDVADRTVHSMLFDYQGLPQGGQGYLRLLHFDNVGGRIIVRTYSPSLDDFDSDDPSLEPIHQQFEIAYADAGIVPQTKRLAADSFRADVLTTRDIAVLEDVPSGSTRTVRWDAPPGVRGWYVETTNPYGGVDVSEVRTLTVQAPGAPAPGTPDIRGRASVGSTVTAYPGRWPAGTTFQYQWNAGGRPLAGATNKSYRLPAVLKGRKLTVTVTGVQPWSPASSATSAPVTVAAGRLHGQRPVVAGTAELGRRLSVRPGRWGPAPVTHRVQWFAGKRKIRGADETTLRLVRPHLGKRISVRVTGTKPGYAPLALRSETTPKVRR